VIAALGLGERKAGYVTAAKRSAIVLKGLTNRADGSDRRRSHDVAADGSG